MMKTVDCLPHKHAHISKPSINSYYNKRTTSICTHRQTARTTTHNNNKIKKS